MEEVNDAYQFADDAPDPAPEEFVHGCVCGVK